MITTSGKAYDHKGGIAVKTKRPPVDNLSDEVMVLWRDKREISPEQRRKSWALIGEISAACGYLNASDKKQLNGDMKRKFLLERMDELTADAIRRFSLSDVDMTTARLYIDFLVSFVVEHGIPTREPLAQLAEDVEAYVYACLKYKRCAVCGKKPDLHHCSGSAVGMGRNRKTIIHEGLDVMPLCRLHHSECHTMPQNEFNEKYHIVGLSATKEICKEWGLKYECD